MKKVIFLCFTVFVVSNSFAQPKPKPKPKPKADTIIQYALVFNAGQLEQLKNFISNPTYFTTEGGEAYWNSQIAPLIRPFKAPVQLPAPPDSANKK